MRIEDLQDDELARHDAFIQDGEAAYAADCIAEIRTEIHGRLRHYIKAGAALTNYNLRSLVRMVRDQSLEFSQFQQVLTREWERRRVKGAIEGCGWVIEYGFVQELRTKYDTQILNRELFLTSIDNTFLSLDSYSLGLFMSNRSSQSATAPLIARIL